MNMDDHWNILRFTMIFFSIFDDFNDFEDFTMNFE